MPEVDTDQKRLRLRIADPRNMFPILLLLLLVALWGTTLNLIEAERTGAELAAAASARELAETYEAQVVRALREIDQTLKFVKYTYRYKGEQQVLADLKERKLLLPDFLFVVSVINDMGDLSTSTRMFEARNVANEDYFKAQLAMDELFVGLPRKDQESGEWKLVFSRRLVNDKDEFAGIVSVSVDAWYFVSGYEASNLGEQGVLGLLGTDGVFRVRRTGETIVSSEEIVYEQLVTDSEDEFEEAEARVMINDWDGVERYTRARKLFEFPLAVVLGLSVDEKLQPIVELKRRYLSRAFLASLALMGVMAVLGGLSLKLQRSRQEVLKEQMAHAERVEYLAYHDGLTGLANRSLFSELLNQGIAQSSRYKRKLALLFLDLDRFKLINDTLGHDAGDELLKGVAIRLQDSLREADIVARLGGDEFVVILPDSNDEKDLSEVAGKILRAVGEPFMLAGQKFRITVSIGISIYPQDGLDEQSLIKSADLAMYHAKEGGKNNFRFYSDELNKESLERMALESGLRAAMERNELLLYYQEKRELLTNEVTGVEALLRWQHPELGLVAPMQFIPLAEQTGLIIPIGKWVIETACKQSVAWQAEGMKPRKMAINLTARQFADAHLVEDIANALRVSDMDPKLLELEITEAVFMSDVDSAVEVLTRIKKMGVRVAIDNFGTSYTSLSTLDKFKFDVIKIDGSIIRDAATNVQDRLFTEAIISMGKRLALTVVAEGVETEEQAQFLRSRDCDEVQGFFYDEPESAEIKSAGWKDISASPQTV